MTEASGDNGEKRVRHGQGIGLGIALGVALGAAFDNVGLGIALGIAIGAAIDTVRVARSEAESAERDG